MAKTPFDYDDSDALPLALSVVLDAATKAMAIKGSKRAVFPCNFSGRNLTVYVEADPEEPTIGVAEDFAQAVTELYDAQKPQEQQTDE